MACTGSPDTPTPTTPPADTDETETDPVGSTADTGPFVSTADTGPPCVPLATPDPSGGPPVLYVRPMTALGGGGGEWVQQGHYVFIIESFVGFTWNAIAPWESDGAMWFGEHLLPATTADRFITPGGVYSPGDITGDQIDDLVVFEENISEGVEHMVLPGPIAQYTNPVLESAGILPLPDFPSSFIPGNTPVIPYCGDLNGDGQEDLCSSWEVHLTPFDGSADWTRPYDVNTRGFVADMDADDINELYVVSGTDVERFILTPSGQGPEPGVFEGLDQTYWPMDLDQDGSDDLYTIGPAGVVRVTSADFAVNTVQTTPISGQSPRTMRQGDFDGDGEMEVFFVEQDVVQLLEQDATVVLTIRPEFPTTTGTFADSVSVGDADDNGVDDLVFGASGGGEIFYVPNPLSCLS